VTNQRRVTAEAPLRFGVLGVAAITPRALTEPVRGEPRAVLQAIAARDRGRAEAYAGVEAIPHVEDDYQAVIEREDVDAVYVPLPISLHREWTLKALAAGKHVMCEKSIALNAGEAREMAAAARDAGLVLMDAFHYRYHPAFVRTVELLRAGRIGTIERLEAIFHVPVTDPDNIRLNYALGGGVTMDIGCYPVTWVRHAAGEEPEVVSASAVVGPPDVDVALEAELRFPSGATGHVSGDMRPEAEFVASLTVTGSEGRLHFENPIAPQRGHRIELETGDGLESFELDRRPTYAYQLDAFLDAVDRGASLWTDGEEAVRQMEAIDACYRAAGLPVRGS
jgi:predicted dehydrogenase